MALILAASQDLVLAKAIVRCMTMNQHRVVAVSQVQDAYAWLQDSKANPDLIIADVGLRSFGGQEFVIALRTSENWKRIPILVQTKSQQCEIFEFCEGTLRKPYSLLELVKSVNLILSNGFLAEAG